MNDVLAVMALIIGGFVILGMLVILGVVLYGLVMTVVERVDDRRWDRRAQEPGMLDWCRNHPHSWHSKDYPGDPAWYWSQHWASFHPGEDFPGYPACLDLTRSGVAGHPSVKQEGADDA